MTKINTSILSENGEATLTVTVEGDPNSPYMAHDDHPNFKLMIAAIVSGEYEELPGMFNVAQQVALEFQRLSERVTVEHGQVRFDGVAVDTTLTQHILDAVSEGADEDTYKALVAFMEKVQTNPEKRSREQLYDWINAQEGLTITEDGDMVGYKYVNTDSEFGYRSSAGGVEPVRVTWPSGHSKHPEGYSEVFTGRIPNPLGGLIEMPRDLVDSDPNRTCSVGLHIGAWNYVKRSGTILEVHVNPRDVVAVPTDYNGEKVRACRYRVVGPITQKYGQAVKKAGEAPKADVRNGEKPEPSADLDLTLQPLREQAEAVLEPTPVRFNRGDRVVFAEHYTEEFKLGTAATVTEGNDSDDLVGVKSDAGDYTRVFSKRLRKVEADPYSRVTIVTAEEAEPEYAEGDRVVDQDGDEGTVQEDLTVKYDDTSLSGTPSVSDRDFNYTVTDRSGRSHGKGGATSQAAKGRGLNPAQDPKTGKFVNGRPGSQRDPRTGRFGG